MDDEERQAVFAYAERKLDAKDCRIIQQEPFLDGFLAMIRFKTSSEDLSLAYAYVYRNKGSVIIALFSNIEEFSSYLKDKKWFLRPAVISNFQSFFSSVDAIAGIIAITMTLLISFLLLKDQTAKIPDVLASSISVILGFYFGRASGKRDA